MKILYILGAYRPNMSANGVCSDNVIKQLATDGHDVTVLCNATVGFPKQRFENGVEIITVKQRLFLRICEKCEAISKKKRFYANVLKKIGYVINKIQLMIMMPVWPVISPITIRKFRKTALKLQAERGFDAVISVYTPIETLLAGAAVKEKYPEIKYYPYFLDSLSGGYGPRIFSDKKTINAGIKIEKKVFKIADGIVLMESSRIHQMKYNSEFSEKFNFLDIPMFVPREKNKVNSEKKDYKKLLYIGSIPVAIRNPDPLIKMLAEISDENVECEFIGNIDCPERFSDLKEKFGDKLEFTGYISHDRIADKINSADVLLNIGNSNNTMVPSKIFEYMSYGKPIISTYVIDDEPSLKYLKKYPCALMVDGRNNDSIKEKVLDFIWNSDDVDSFELVGNFYTNTPKAFSNEIIQI